MSNMITEARPHHKLVEDLELVFLGLYNPEFQKVKRSKLSRWQMVNEWLMIASLCFVVSIVADLILNF